VIPRLLLLTVALLVPVSVAAQSETVEYYATDQLGSVRVVFDANGNILSRMDYKPFGQDLSGASGMPANRFANLFRDGEADLDYAQARSYQARTGRFNAPDPVYAGLFEPQKWNRYSYALNDPVSMIDPDGRNPLMAASFGLWCAVNCPTRPPPGATGSPERPFQSSATEASMFEALWDDFVSFLDEINPLGTAVLHAPRPGGENAEPSGGGSVAGTVLATVTPIGLRKNVGRRIVGTVFGPRGGRTALGNLRRHWNDHKAEFPELKSVGDYFRFAKSFFTNPPAGTLTFTRPNGDLLQYHPESNTFGVLSGDGTVRTVFRPNEGMTYWAQQTGGG
jgi:RHS repeat-associated protein